MPARHVRIPQVSAGRGLFDRILAVLLFALADVPSLRSLEINDSATLAASLLQLAGFDTVSGTVFVTRV